MSLTLRADLLRNIGSLMRRTSRVISHPLRQALEDFFVFPRSNKTTQVLLSMQYKEMLALKLPLPTFEDVEFRAYSQFGEDGILLYLFSLLGATNKKCVEICGGGGFDNTANLLINHGWNGLFFEGSESHIQRGQQFYAAQGFSGEIDLLSLDMDGMDYWVWKAIEGIRPRVVVLEYNSVWEPDVAVTVPYRPDFIAENNNVSPLYNQRRRVVNTLTGKPIADRVDNYFGASLAAFVKLGKQKGYRLVGCERYGFNAFFMKSGIGEEILPEIPASACFTHPYTQYATTVRKQRVIDREWVQV